MKRRKKPYRNPAINRGWLHFSKMISTFFYSGKFPFAPGTFGSFVGCLFFLSVSHSWVLCLAVFLLVLIFGIICSGVVERAFGQKDPGCVVVDEVAGVFIVFWGVRYWEPVILVAGFFLFRFFDVWKPTPVRQMQNLPGGWGVMLDDVVAALYVNLLLRGGEALMLRWGYF